MGSEWKSDEKLLIFVSLISPAKILLFVTSSIRHSVLSPDETPRSSFKIHKTKQIAISFAVIFGLWSIRKSAKRGHGTRAEQECCIMIDSKQQKTPKAQTLPKR